MNVTLVDYGAGNPSSVVHAFQAIGAQVARASSPDEIGRANALVIPGVGHFQSTASLNDSWRRAIRARLDDGAALLGICLGMQWLFEGSDEAGEIPGFGLIRGRCFRLSGPVKVPHVGWNTLTPTTSSGQLLDGIGTNASMYFTHTYAAPVAAETSATTDHGGSFSAVVESARVFGTQFHPEKSGAAGLRVLANFIVTAREAR